MTRYTVTYTRDALQSLARLWLSAVNRRAITLAGDSIDELLRDNAPDKGLPVGSTMRQVVVAPLVAEFTVEEDDRIVTIRNVRHIGELTNGR